MTDTRELVELIRAALNFCNAAAGEGLEIDGMSPEDFLMRYSDATGFEDWDRIGDHAADTITALSERCRVLEEAVEAVIQFHNSTFTGPCAAQNKGRQWKGVLRKCLNARAALTSGGRG